MDFELSDEQRLIAEAADRFVRDRYDFERRRALEASEIGYDEAHWTQFADLGWLAMPLPEDHGGLGAGAAEVMLLMEAFGRGLVLEPYVPSVILAGGLLADLGRADQKDKVLTAVAQGQEKLAFAFVEQGMGYDLSYTACRAEPDGEGWRLSGRKQIVLGGEAADHLLVLARTEAEPGQAHGLALFLIGSEAAGVARTRHATADGHRAADFVLDGAEAAAADRVGEGDVVPAIQASLDRACAAVLAEAVGAIDHLNRLTGDYLATRTQFGRPIGSFQVLQHRMVDMVMAAEEARSMLYYATLSLDATADERAYAVSAAKVKISEAARFVARQAVQLHGGMGVSDAMSVGHYFKRIFMIEQLFGDSRFHRARVARLSRAEAA